MTPEVKNPLRIFCSYSHKDEEHLNDLRDWLRGLERQGLIEWWHDREIVPGREYEKDIDKNLRTTDIILLLVSPAFMASDYVYAKEVSVAVERHDRGEARVIPIIVRWARWERAPFAKLQVLPRDAKPVAAWDDRDEAWYSVAEGVEKAVEELLVERQERSAKDRYRKAVEEAWVGERLSSEETERLDALVSKLGLSMDTTAEIERDALGATKEAVLERQDKATRERERKERSEKLYDQARRMLQNQEWQAVIDVFEQMHSERRAYPDPDRLLESAREALRSTERLGILSSLLEQQEKILLSLDMNGWVELIRGARERLLADNVKVLVLGEFNTGKSTFINALLGAEVLPAYATLTTAIAAEVKWGEAPRAVLHFKASKDSVVSPPREVPVESLEEDLAIREPFNKEQSIRESPFDKVEVFWPLEFLRNGVEFIDTPGLNEHQVRERLTLNYLPAVELVIFIMSALQPGPSRSETATIERLHAAGYRNIMFVITRLKQLVPRERERVIQFVLRKLRPLTELGEEGVFLIDSRDALDGRHNDDSLLTHQSGIPAVEATLEDLLEVHRERTKIMRAANVLKISIREAQRIVAERKYLTKERLGALKGAAKRRGQAKADPVFKELASARRRLNNVDSKLNTLMAPGE